MTDLTRYRITGGVFLIALAAIVLPMIFDADGLDSVTLPDIPPGQRVEPVAAPVVDEVALKEAEQSRDVLDEDLYREASGTRLGDPELTLPNRAKENTVEGWAVQLASFDEHANAVALRDRLRNDGYQAVISDVRRLTGSASRVAIGPVIRREDAERLRDEVSQRYELDAIVVGFSH
jgi:DedD protein